MKQFAHANEDLMTIEPQWMTSMLGSAFKNSIMICPNEKRMKKFGCLSAMLTLKINLE